MNDEQSQLDATDVGDSQGTYWLAPHVVAHEALHPSLRAAIERRSDADGFVGYIAPVYELPGDLENGHFHFAVNSQTSKAVGLHTVSLVLGEVYSEDIELAIGPIWLYADSEIKAADDLYQILKDVGRLA